MTILHAQAHNLLHSLAYVFLHAFFLPFPSLPTPPLPSPPFPSPLSLIHRAGTNCDLFVLTKTDLDRALSYYPHIAEQIREVAGNRANLVKKRSQIAAKAAAEGKSASDAAKAAAQVCMGEVELVGNT